MILASGPGGFSPSYSYFTEDRSTRFGRLAAIELGCLKLSVAETIECLRQSSVTNLLAVGYINQLTAYPNIDASYMSEPYLPATPFSLMSSGEYSSDVDVMIG